MIDISPSVSLETIYGLCRGGFSLLASNLKVQSKLTFRSFYLQCFNLNIFTQLKKQVFFFFGINPRLDLPQSISFFKTILLSITSSNFAFYFGGYSVFTFGLNFIGYSFNQVLAIFTGKA